MSLMPTEGHDKGCYYELNKQMQGLQARISQAENDIVAHYQGISTLVAALADTPAAAAAAAVSAFYNFEALGFKILEQLVSMIPIINFKELTMEMAAALIEGMAAELEAMIGDVLASITAMINGLVDVVLSVEQNILALEEQLANAIESEVEAIQAQLVAAEAELEAAKANLQKALDLKATASGFLLSQKNMAGCLTANMHITT